MAAPLADALRFLCDQGLGTKVLQALFPPIMPVSAKTANYTILASDPCGTLFTNRGAAGAVSFTLPSPTLFKAGHYFDFVGIADQSITVVTLTADTLIGFNDIAADSVAMSTAGAKIGAHARVISDGTSWIFIGDTVGVTYTLAT